MQKVLKAKRKSFECKINTNFHDDVIPKKYCHCVYFFVILIDFVFEIDKNYYPQVFLEESQQIIKEKQIIKYQSNEMTQKLEMTEKRSLIKN